MQTSYGLVPVGWVQSALKALDDAPNQREGAPRAWIRFDEQVAEGAVGLPESIVRDGVRIEQIVDEQGRLPPPESHSCTR